MLLSHTTTIWKACFSPMWWLLQQMLVTPWKSLLPTSASVVTSCSLWHESSCLPLLKTFVLAVGHTHHPGWSPHLTILNLFPSAKSLLPCKTTYSLVPGISTQASLEGHYSAHHTSWHLALGVCVAREAMWGPQTFELSGDSVTWGGGGISAQCWRLPRSREKEVWVQPWDISGKPATHCWVTSLEKF